LALGDFNGDGILDLATTNIGSTTMDTVSVLLGKGGGEFSPRADYPTGPVPHGIALGDLNNDGKLDIEVANSEASYVSVLLASGDGAFAARMDYPTGINPLAVALGDLNGDGRLDIVAASNATGIASTVSVLLGAGDGTFAANAKYAIEADAVSVAVGDLNRDDRPDLVTTSFSSDSVTVLLGSCQ